MKISRLFFDHPASVGETYWQHLLHAMGFGLRMLVSGMACMLHGMLPFLFVRTGSRQVALLHDQMIVNRSKLPDFLDFVI